MKVTMNINDELLERVDRYAKSNYVSRTSVFSMAANQFMLQNEVVSVLSELKDVIISFSNSGQVTDEQLQQLSKIENFLEIITGE